MSGGEVVLRCHGSMTLELHFSNRGTEAQKGKNSILFPF